MRSTRGLGPAAAALALVASLAASPTRAADATTDAAAGARDVVRRALDDALAALRDKSLTPDERVERVEQVALGHFDFPTMSRLVLARNWRRFDAAQQADFEEQFRRLLSRRYGRRLERYRDERVEILGTRDEPRGDVTVRTVVVGGRYEGVQIDYRMRRRNDQWRAIDVVIEGVSLVGSYRSQFSDLLERKTPEQVLALLRERNAKPADQEDDAPDGAALDGS